ncbi:MAG: TetR/AcrR family transcriptional regulator [Rhodoferax sp.]
MPDADTPLPPLPILPKRSRGRPRKTDRERDDGNRRRALVAAAAALFRRQGFAATSTRDIAQAVGMHSGSPFYHFKSKEALLYAVMEEGMHRALQHQALALAQCGAGAGPKARLRALVESHFETLLGPGNDFVPVMLYENRSLDASQRSGLAALKQQYEAAWHPVLQELHAHGDLVAPVKLARLFMLGALNWAVQWFDPEQEASVQDLTDACMALFVKE